MTRAANPLPAAAKTCIALQHILVGPSQRPPTFPPDFSPADFGPATLAIARERTHV
jgi:hypothetical protein